jgi:hypothetical protein
MITNTKVITPIQFNTHAIAVAVAYYAKYSPIPFRDDLLDYLGNGFVVSRPNLFAMGKVIDLAPQPDGDVDREKNHRNPDPGEPTWFIRMAVGDLGELLTTLPFYLPKITFCRKRDGKLRVYSVDRLAKAIMNRIKSRNTNRNRS